MRRLRKLRWALRRAHLPEGTAERDALFSELVIRLWRPTEVLGRAYRATVGRTVRVVGVTGSSGKTTTVAAIRAVFGLPDRRIHRMEVNNHHAWIGGHLLSHHLKHRHLAVEIGIDRPDRLARYARTIKPDVSVVTSIGSSHHKAFAGRQALRSEKAELVRVLGSRGCAVLNGDDPHVRWMAGQTRAKVITFGFDTSCDVHPVSVRLDWPSGTRVEVNVDGRKVPIRSRLVGRVNIYPLLAALAVALHEGVDLDEAAQRLSQLQPRPGRLEQMVLPCGAVVLRDDFKSQFETIVAALELLEEIPASQRTVVLGKPREEFEAPIGQKYRDIGRALAGTADRAILVGLSEDGEKMVRLGALDAGMSAHAITSKPIVQHVPDLLRGSLGNGDVLLLKGSFQQRLVRVALDLAGKRVRCWQETCVREYTWCDDCRFLERGGYIPFFD